MKEIYQQTVEEVLERVNGKKSGLTSEQVKRSREKCGWNELTEGKKKGILQIFFEQYKDFLVLILIASAIISGMLWRCGKCGSYRDGYYDQCNLGNNTDGKRQNNLCRV